MDVLSLLLKLLEFSLNCIILKKVRFKFTFLEGKYTVDLVILGRYHDRTVSLTNILDHFSCS